MYPRDDSWPLTAQDSKAIIISFETQLHFCYLQQWLLITCTHTCQLLGIIPINEYFIIPICTNTHKPSAKL